MTPHLQHRLLLHIAQHNAFPNWASSSDLRNMAPFVKALPGQRWQLSPAGWQQLGAVVVVPRPS